MTNNVINSNRYQFIVENLEFYKISPEKFETKNGDVIPWTKLVTIDNLDETCNFTMHSDCNVAEGIKTGDLIRVVGIKDRYFKEKIISIEKM